MSTPVMANLLAFDTSTEQLAVALRHGPATFTCNEAGGALASARLLPAVMLLLAQADLQLAQLDAIAFGCGPGAFTGLRTSASVAQGLALGAQRPVLALDSLMLVADDARHQLPVTSALDIAVCMDARMDEVYAGLYRWQGECWLTLVAPALYSLPALAQQGWQAQAVCGSALSAFGDRLTGFDAVASRMASEQDRASALLRVAEQAWREGLMLDAAEALPLYLRDKVAQTTTERAAAKALKATAA